MMDDQTCLRVDVAQLYALLGPGFGHGGSGQPDPDNPIKPGPWDPVIRVAVADVVHHGVGHGNWRHGPQPEPWIAASLESELLGLIARRFPAVWDVIGGARNIGDLVSLNPQPLPPVEIFAHALGAALVARTEMLAEVAGAVQASNPAERSIIIVGGYVRGLVDEYCGNDFRLRWPIPGPPPWWFREQIGAHDLLRLGASLHSAGRNAYDPAVQQAFGDASRKLAEVGIERLQ